MYIYIYTYTYACSHTWIALAPCGFLRLFAIGRARGWAQAPSVPLDYPLPAASILSLLVVLLL